MSDVPNGFDVEGPRKVTEGESMKLRCTASVENPSQIAWFKHTINGERELNEENSKSVDNELYKIHTTSTKLSFSKDLAFANVSLMDRGIYICRAKLPRNPYDKEFDAKHLPSTSPLIDSRSLGRNSSSLRVGSQ